MATGATAQRKPRGADLLAAEIRRRLGPVPALADPPLVSIVVLNRNGTEYLPGLLTGLSDRTEYPAFELIVVDNGSSDGSLDLLCAAEVPFPLSILANPHNETFSDGCNQGAGEASGQLLLFLNNDTEAFEPGWLTELVACLRGSGAGAVAATLLCRDEEHRADFRYGYGVAHRGLVFREEGETIHPVLDGWEADPLDERLGEDAERRAVAAACLLVDRAAFERVGGFTHGYVYGAEDVDLCLKLRAAGFRLLCSGRAIAIHHPVSTRRTKPFEEQRALKLANRRLLWERWGPRLRREYELDRLAAGGLSGRLRSEVEALGFCFEVSDPAAAVIVEPVCAELRNRGHRCLLLGSERSEDPGALNYDVAVHVSGVIRHVPKPGQVNVLWSIGGADALAEVERSRYDLVLADDPPGQVEEFVDRLIAAVDPIAQRR